MTDSSSPTMALSWFFVITTIYVFIKYYVTDPIQTNIYLGIYLSFVVIGEYIINLSLTDKMCGSRQWNTALLVTLIPWVLIFGILNIIILIFPGWLSPFSNTFGYGIAKVMGVGSLIDKIFKPKLESSDGSNKVMVEALEHIYSDKSLLINEITESNFNNFWKNMEPLIKPNYFKDIAIKQELFDFVRLKNIVAEYIWYLLTGGLVTSVGYNYIVNNGCSQSVKDMKRRHKEYEETMEKNKALKKDNQPRLYTMTE